MEEKHPHLRPEFSWESVWLNILLSSCTQIINKSIEIVFTEQSDSQKARSDWPDTSLSGGHWLFFLMHVTSACPLFLEKGVFSVIGHF